MTLACLVLLYSVVAEYIRQKTSPNPTGLNGFCLFTSVESSQNIQFVKFICLITPISQNIHVVQHLRVRVYGPINL